MNHDWNSAIQIVQQLLIDSAKAPAGNSKIWLTIVNAAKYVEDQKTQTDLFLLGIQGLARLNQFASIEKLTNESKINIPENRFVARWIMGQKLYGNSEDSPDVEELKRAQNLIRQAVETAEPSVTPVDRCFADIFGPGSSFGWRIFRNPKNCFDLRRLGCEPSIPRPRPNRFGFASSR